MKHEDMHGPTKREQEILALDDAGYSADEIAAQMSVRVSYVKSRLSHLTIYDTANDKAFFEMSRRGSTMLSQRIAEVHGHANR